MCDNVGVVSTSANVQGLLKRRSTALVYHLTRENIAVGVIELQYVSTGHNVADIMTKPLAGGSFSDNSTKLVVGYRVKA